MTITSAKKFVQAAHDGAYAVGGFNTINLEWTQAILRAAQKKQAPILLQTSMAPAQYMGGYRTCQRFITSLVEDMRITVPVALHLDHGNYEAVKECIKIGYSSVMFDGSMLPIEENLSKSAELIELAHAEGVSIECEIGAIGGSEDGIYGEGKLASIEDAMKMAALGVDFLAIGIGNIHGPYPKDWKGLDFEHLKKLKQLLPNLPFVLHGASGIPDEQIKKAITLGVAKINVNTECHLAFAEATIDTVHDFERHKTEYLNKKYYDLRTFLRPGFEAIEKTISERIEVFESSKYLCEPSAKVRGKQAFVTQ
ncbi:class II fructose-bisphosphate aldolase [Lactovum odontotermitis]